MQISAKLVHILSAQTGTGENGEWKKQDIVFETQDQFPKKICISFWGDKLQSVELRESETYVIDFDIESREYNGKWFTDLKAWKIVQNASPTSQHSIFTETKSDKKSEYSEFTEEEDNFPF